MCGIFGVIGESFDSDISFEILTRLFERTENRGEDASGFWGTQPKDGNIIYHKAPVKSTEFVKDPMWLKVKKFNPNLLICHCRAASQGSGLPIINKNNHPFVSSDRSIGLIHNGIIKDFEYTALKKKYSVYSQCDSEMFLRVFEHDREDPLVGVQKIWSYMSRNHMAVSIGEYLPEGNRCLWLLRNQHRSIWLADLRGLLGQIFFFSTPDIWDEAAANCKYGFDYLRRVKQIEIPEEEVWKFTIDGKKTVPYNEQLEKFTLDKGEYKNWNWDNEELIPIILKEPVAKVVTGMDKDEEPIEKKSKGNQKSKNLAYADPGNQSIPQRQDDILFPSVENKEKSLRTLTNLCDDIRKIIDNIETCGENLIEENSISNTDLAELFGSLEQTSLDLEGTGRILDNVH